MKIVDDFVGQWQLHAWRCLHVNLDIHEVIFAAIMAAFFYAQNVIPSSNKYRLAVGSNNPSQLDIDAWTFNWNPGLRGTCIPQRHLLVYFHSKAKWLLFE
jgi:hypothetical protein